MKKSLYAKKDLYSFGGRPKKIYCSAGALLTVINERKAFKGMVYTVIGPDDNKFAVHSDEVQEEPYKIITIDKEIKKEKLNHTKKGKSLKKNKASQGLLFRY